MHEYNSNVSYMPRFVLADSPTIRYAIRYDVVLCWGDVDVTRTREPLLLTVNRVTVVRGRVLSKRD